MLVTGVQARPELNGRIGTARAFDVTKGRVPVILDDSGGDGILLRRSNLVSAADDFESTFEIGQEGGGREVGGGEAGASSPISPICHTPFSLYITIIYFEVFFFQLPLSSSSSARLRLALARLEAAQVFFLFYFSHSPISPICHTPFSLYITIIYFEVFFSRTHPFPPYVTPHSPYISQSFILRFFFLALTHFPHMSHPILPISSQSFIFEVFFSLTHPFPPHVTPHSPYTSADTFLFLPFFCSSSCSTAGYRSQRSSSTAQRRRSASRCAPQARSASAPSSSNRRLPS